MLLWLLDIRTNYVRSPSSTPFALKYDFYRRKMVVTYNASVTIGFRFFYDAGTMSKSSFPFGYRRETQPLSYGLTGIVASTILLTPHSDKFCKPVARRYIAGWSHDPRTGTARWLWGHHKNLDNNMIVDSWDNRREPILTSHGHRAIF